MAKLCVILAVVAVVAQTHAQSTEDKFRALVKGCAASTGASDDDSQVAFDGTKRPANDNQKCLMECIYKQLGMINAAGTISKDGVDNLIKRLYQGTSNYDKALKMAAACDTVKGTGEKCSLGFAIRDCIATQGEKLGFMPRAY